MICSQADCTNEGAAYRLALRQIRSVLCPACHASLSSMGMVWVPERRTVDVTPIRERRQPEWLNRISGRDETGRIVA